MGKLLDFVGLLILTVACGWITAALTSGFDVYGFLVGILLSVLCGDIYGNYLGMKYFKD